MSAAGLRRLREKTERSLQLRGVLGTAALGARFLWYLLVLQTPARRAVRRREREFDRVHSVDTSGTISPIKLEVPSPNWIHGLGFQNAPIDTLRRILDGLCIRHEDFAFVDLGSGKGRALLLAADYPFRRVIGVEFAPELYHISAQNLRTYRSDTQRCFAIEAVCQDAARFVFPTEPLVLFLYNPFGPEVLKSVVANLVSSLRERPRDAFAAYMNPKHATVLDGTPSLRRHAQDRDYIIWARCD